MKQRTHEPLEDSTYVLCWILAGVFAGVVFAGALIIYLYAWCEKPALLCSVVERHPPWALISGVAATPSLILLWRWRTTARGREALQRDEEIAQRDREVLPARFANAVRMLEQDGVGAFAGLHTLRQIGVDSPETYNPLILETLTTFIRQKSPELTTEQYYDQEHDPLEWRQISQLVQSALSVLGSSIVPDGFSVDLRKVDLTGADMTNFQLNGARLDESELDDLQAPGISLIGASLVRTSLLRADLRGAALDRADLRSARLMTARLEGATFRGARYNDTGGFPEGFDHAAMGTVFDNS